MLKYLQVFYNQQFRHLSKKEKQLFSMFQYRKEL